MKTTTFAEEAFFLWGTAAIITRCAWDNLKIIGLDKNLQVQCIFVY